MIKCPIGLPKEKCLIEKAIERGYYIWFEGEWVSLREVFQGSEQTVINNE